MVKSVHHFINYTFTAPLPSRVETYEDIEIPFKPSRVIVKSILYYPDSTSETGISLIRCSGLVDGGKGILCHFSPMCELSPNSSFHLDKQINGRYRIEFLNSDMTNLTNRSGQLSIDLEFME